MSLAELMRPILRSFFETWRVANYFCTEDSPKNIGPLSNPEGYWGEGLESGYLEASEKIPPTTRLRLRTTVQNLETPQAWKLTQKAGISLKNMATSVGQR